MEVWTEENSKMLTGFLAHSGEQVMIMMEISDEKLFPTINHSGLNLGFSVSLRVNTLNMIRTRILKSM